MGKIHRIQCINQNKAAENHLTLKCDGIQRIRANSITYNTSYLLDVLPELAFKVLQKK